MELELTRRCRRNVAVAEFVAAHATSSNGTRTGHGLEAAPASAGKAPLFRGVVELLYARNVWLAARTDIWASRGNCFRQVKCSSVHLQAEAEEVALPVTNGEAMRAMQKVKALGLRVAANGDEPPALTGDELTGVLEEVAKQLVKSFQEVQVQVLQAATSQRAKFEYEMLQHHPGLEVLVLRSQSAGPYVLFALPLLGEKPRWDPKMLVEAENPEAVHVPDGFKTPNFAVATDGLTIFIGYPLEQDDGSKRDSAWPLQIEWPARMLLSSQVTQIPPSSEGQSSVELLSSCEQMFLQQWRQRKEFIAALRQHVIVLEYDTVDFSQVFFMLQEQLNDRAPLRILVLRLQFTAAFFLTSCTSDLQVTLLDGGASADPVAVALLPSPDPAVDSQDSVAHFLGAARKGLIRHFYGE